MRSLILVLLLLNALFLSAQEATNNNLSFDNSLRTESEKLLTEWMDTFLTTIAKSKNSRPKNKMCH